MPVDDPERAVRSRVGALTIGVCLLMLMTFAASAGRSEEPGSGTFVDPRDGREYRWVRIGSQVWMAENLRFEPDSGWTCWNDDRDECAKKGVFYDWATACSAPPPGWHLPSDGEWMTLERELGLPEDELELVGLDRENDAGAAIKKEGCWPVEYEGTSVVHSDETGFSAVPTGFFALGEYTHSGYAGWWTSTPEGDKAWVRALSFHNNMITRAPNDKKFRFPVRCVRDAGGDGAGGEGAGQPREYRTRTGKTIEVVESHPVGMSMSTIEISTRGFEHEFRETFEDRDPVADVLTADLDGNGFDEIYVVTRSAGSGSYGNVLGFASNNDRSLSMIHLPEAREEDRPFDGYRGHDVFTLEGGKLVRTFTVYREGDPNAAPTGGTRRVLYALHPGEAMWQLKIERSVTIE